MAGKIWIFLWCIKSPVLLVPKATGVVYTNQTCGTACLQEEIEGFAIPISDEYSDIDYELSLDFRIRKLFPDGNPGNIDFRLAEAIQSILDSYNESKWVRIDFEKLSESHEAWLKVKLYSGNDYIPSDLIDGQEAILTWQNSD
ncbi:hypothetical protein EHQ53_10495 [Leptospira langatensis]|uniref:Uncharacterized protein n=1 Tax=Leptospira langatensis TaxID=2484983 RepID=A0A5F1ZTY9_9LEPT|nr:DUF6210 family protein [Leptospira langatensis]TGJ99007.1 hypothetical protein EHO57_16005 [Leptospira langatensis]TGL40425.1 hypothetical protein EHQ53_10495 [Leptospira langatensis]